MLANDKYPITQRETLIRIVRDRGVKRGMSNRNARRRRDDSTDVLVGTIPQFHAERQMRGDVVQVWVG